MNLRFGGGRGQNRDVLGRDAEAPEGLGAVLGLIASREDSDD